MNCVNCRRVAPSLCTYHIMDLSGCDMDEMEREPEGVLEGALRVYHCPHCGNSVPNTMFCKVCYSYSHPAYLMQWLADAPRWRCEDCGAPKIIDTTQDMNIGPCGRCLRRGSPVVTPLTPERLAQWLKEVRT